MLTMQKLHQNVQGAISSRGRIYESVFCTALRFEKDDTNAANDTGHLQGILNLLKIPADRNRVLILREDNPTPREAVSSMIEDLNRVTGAVKGQSLVILHYAGHGAKDEDGFFLVSKPGSDHQVYFESFNPLWKYKDSFQRTDVIFILDCCFSGLATRLADTTRHRSVELIAAVGAAQTAFSNSYKCRQLDTFTHRLSIEVSKAIGRMMGKTSSIGFREIIETMRPSSNADRIPEYKLRLGCLPIRVSVSGSKHSMGVSQPIPRLRRSSSTEEGSSSASTSQVKTRYAVIFSATVDDCDMRNGEHREIVDWLRSAGPTVGLELHSVYKSRTYLLTFHANWSIWAVLDGLRGYQLVGETFGENLLETLDQGPLVQRLQMSGSHSGLKEHIPFRPQGGGSESGAAKTEHHGTG